jgi:hypothetical protein
MDTSQNSSLSQIAQKVAGISVSSPDNCQQTKITKVRIIKTFHSITKAGVDVFSSRFYKRKHASFHKLFYCNLGSFRAVSSVNYQTVCNDLYLGSVKTTNCFYRRHNPAEVGKSQLVTRPHRENCNFGSLYDSEVLELRKTASVCNRSLFKIRSAQLSYSPRTSTCRTVPHSVQ